jgi:plasmid stability protein
MADMANVTLAIDDKLLQAARVRAVKEGTSVNDICRQAIENYARAEGRHDWLARYDELTARIAATRGRRAPGRVQRQTREQMYDEILDECMPTFLGTKRPRA